MASRGEGDRTYVSAAVVGEGCEAADVAGNDGNRDRWAGGRRAGDLVQGRSRTRLEPVNETLFFVLSSFWAGAVHAATPGHGKTIAAAYIVGARGKPVDAVILGIFVTLSHTTGIVLVGVLASLGASWGTPQRIEAYLALAMGVLVVGLGIWLLWTQRDLVAVAMGAPPSQAAIADESEAGAVPRHGPHPSHRHTHGGQVHKHDHASAHRHGAVGANEHAEGWHSHGWGTYHAHRIDLVTDARPKIAVLLALGAAGGLLPDPTALALLLASLSSGRVMLGLATVLVFSLGFAAALVAVGLVAAQVGRKVLDWLSGLWAVRVQIATTLLILGMGIVLTLKAARQVAVLA
jgi:nickel/cobalt exporter